MFRSLRFVRPMFHALFVMALAVLFVMPSVARADTVAYEFTGEWRQRPSSVRAGHDVLGTIWRLDVNDDAPAASNDKVSGNALTLTATHGRFSEVPTVCVNRDSALSDEGRVLTCDLGDRFEGTAILAFASLTADGRGGDLLSVTGAFRGRTATLPAIPIVPPSFAMDAKFDDGAPTSTFDADHTDTFSVPDQKIGFPFSLSHARNSPDGPSSVSYNLTVEQPDGPEVRLDQSPCVPLSASNPGHPRSNVSGTDGATRFPTCHIVKTGEATFTLTLSDLDYAAGPALDSNGQPLPVESDVIASGVLKFVVAYQSSGGQVRLSASAPTYTATNGDTAADDSANNDNAVPIARGGYTGGWVVAGQRPVNYPGSPWTDTSRVPAGATVMSTSAVGVPELAGQISDNWVCQVLDTDHAVFKAVRLGFDTSTPGSVYYDDVTDGRIEAATGTAFSPIWYHTGDLVNPDGTAADPNDFECGGETKAGDYAFGNQAGWSNEPPADLSTVTAVKAVIPRSFAPLIANNNSLAYLTVEQTLRSDTPVGTDVWTFNRELSDGASSWKWDAPTREVWGRTRDAADMAPYGTLTPDARYPYAGPFRDVLRVVGSQPLVEKKVALPEYAPGQEVDYTVGYGLQSFLADPAPADMVVTDTLPQGLSYVEGSASIAPRSVSDDGRTITWAISGVRPNEGLSHLTYRALLADDVAPGSRMTNDVKVESQTIVRKASAQLVVPNSGYTRIVKEMANESVDAEGGAASNDWTITLSSFGPTVGGVTDVIDVLPRSGDGRGSDFSGTIVVTGVDVPQGAKLYSTTAADVDEDPAAAANGSTGQPSAIWQDGLVEGATALRIVGPGLSYGQSQVTTVHAAVAGAQDGAVYVASAVGRTDTTQLRMRTSARFILSSSPTPTGAVPTTLQTSGQPVPTGKTVAVTDVGQLSRTGVDGLAMAVCAAVLTILGIASLLGLWMRQMWM